MDDAEAKKKLNDAIDSLVATGSKKLLTALLTAIVGKAPTTMPPDGQRPTGPPLKEKDIGEQIFKSPELPLPWDKPKKPTQNYFEFRGLPRKARASSYIDFKLRTPHWFEPYGKMGAGRVVVMKAEDHKKEGDRATKLSDKRIEQTGEVAMSIGLPEEPGAVRRWRLRRQRPRAHAARAARADEVGGDPAQPAGASAQARRRSSGLTR